MEHLLKQLSEFITDMQRVNAYPRNRWIESEIMQVYVRYCPLRVLLGVESTTLDIANVEVVAARRGMGDFTKFLRAAHSMHPWDATYIESVQELRFCDYLMRLGGTLQGPTIPPSVWFPKCQRIGTTE